MPDKIEETPERTPPVIIMGELGCVIVTLAFIILAAVWFIFPFVFGEW